ncbi:hypothetical protein BHE74_00030117 [Ensete ventricosum]|nr:hypothetical protein BHE74_00030117 [Ensete ventricosum]
MVRVNFIPASKGDLGVTAAPQSLLHHGPSSKDGMDDGFNRLYHIRAGPLRVMRKPKAGGDRFVQNLESKWGSAFCGLSDLLLGSDEVSLDLVKPLIDLAKLFPHRVG